MFVVASENATVAELAGTLQADVSPLLAAASFACRLGWAEKFIDPASVLHDSSGHGSLLSDDEDGSQTSVGSANLSNDGNSVQEFSGKESNHARVAFIVDANITSYLMMGSVSPGLPSCLFPCVTKTCCLFLAFLFIFVIIAARSEPV